jgi:hypothetical protein
MYSAQKSRKTVFKRHGLRWKDSTHAELGRATPFSRAQNSGTMGQRCSHWRCSCDPLIEAATRAARVRLQHGAGRACGPRSLCAVPEWLQTVRCASKSSQPFDPTRSAP